MDTLSLWISLSLFIQFTCSCCCQAATPLASSKQSTAFLFCQISAASSPFGLKMARDSSKLLQNSSTFSFCRLQPVNLWTMSWSPWKTTKQRQWVVRRLKHLHLTKSCGKKIYLFRRTNFCDFLSPIQPDSSLPLTAVCEWTHGLKGYKAMAVGFPAAPWILIWGAVFTVPDPALTLKLNQLVKQSSGLMFTHTSFYEASKVAAELRL